MIIPSPTSSQATEPFATDELVHYDDIRILASSHSLFDDDLACLSDEVASHLQASSRLLIQPLDSRPLQLPPRDKPEGGFQWVSVTTKDSTLDVRVLAVTQTTSDIKFSIRLPGVSLGDDVSSSWPAVHLDLYYDPGSHKIALMNRSEVPLMVRSEKPTAMTSDPSHAVNPGTARALEIGVWVVSVDASKQLLALRILEKNTIVERAEVKEERALKSDEKDLAMKSGFDPTLDGGHPLAPVLFPLPEGQGRSGQPISTGSNPFLDAEEGETIYIPNSRLDHVHDSYLIAKGKPISSTTLSSLFRANISTVVGHIIVVKVLKIPNSESTQSHTSGQSYVRNVIRQAETWRREYQKREKLHHRAIAQSFGGDARFLSIYQEDIAANDVASRGVWRDPVTDDFKGDRNDAVRIFRDVADALLYMDTQHLVHNNIKPARIFYSRERGAVLFDFGLVSSTTEPHHSGGTPYYIPPEYIGHRLRGSAGDVWALGVTMLYLLRKISLPDSRGRRDHPRHLHWMINEVNSWKQDKPATAALARMREWLADVAMTTGALNLDNPVERLVGEMLDPNPRSRPGIRNITQILSPSTPKLEAPAPEPSGSSKLLQSFPNATPNDLIWISELIDVGYSDVEITKLLFEREHDAPWIYFDPKAIPLAFPWDHYHIPGCAHYVPTKSSREYQWEMPVLHADQERELRRSIEELCGIGGVTPSSRDRSGWRGVVDFSAENTAASVRLMGDSTAPGPTQISNLETVNRLISFSDALSTAVQLVQYGGLCCDRFTILELPEFSSFLPQVELTRVSFSSISSIRKCLVTLSTSLQKSTNLGQPPASASESWTFSESRRPELTVDEVLSATIRSSEQYIYDLRPTTFHTTLQLSALALQVLSLGFLSYTQAHVGALQPFFLDTPLQKISLHGLTDYDKASSYFVAELVSLSCFGNMLQDKVLVFRRGDEKSHAEQNERLDLNGTPSDILDTWGPGDYVFPRDNQKQPVAIKVGGGYISTPQSKVSRPKYHWSETMPLPLSENPLTLDYPITVGGIIGSNQSCQSDEQLCWEMSSGMFEELGTYRSHYEVAENQAGLQAGPDYVSFTSSRVWAKRPGRTIKSQNLEQEDYMLVPFLESFWGVRVSYCTGLAQRVPLRQLIADLLPAFARTHTGMAASRKWMQLTEPPHSIIDAFARVNSSQQPLSAWLGTLPEDLYNFVLVLIRQILGTLKHTGLSQDGSCFLVAWPWNGIVNRCFRIPLEGGNKWIPVLADSDDCATFAYITNTCLQSATVKCRGPHPTWQNRLHMLETAVLCPTSTQPWALHNERTYFFVKLENNLFWVKARKETTEPASLVRLYSAQSLPRDLRQRLLFKETQKQERRLREKDRTNVAAEDVGIL